MTRLLRADGFKAPALLAALAISMVACSRPSRVEVTSAGAPAPRSAQRFDEVGDFTFQDSRGGTLSKADLVGAPWIGVPFFITCTGPCPSITRDIRAKLYGELEGTGVRIVSFSLDPERDTPEALDEYAKSLDIDRDRWLFVSAPKESDMHDFVRLGLRVPVQRDPKETDPGLAVTHGTRMPVIDEAGMIAGFYDIADPLLGQSPPSLEESNALLAARYALIGNRAKALAAGPSRIPAINASLNGTAFLLLIAGIVAIKNGAKKRHEHLMKLAFLASATFLGFYLYYHFVVLPISGGPTPFNGTGVWKTLYLLLLASHVILAVVNLPMVLRTFWLAHEEDWDRHKRMARWTFPIWAYVSVTGVIVYLVLYPFNPAPAV